MNATRQGPAHPFALAATAVLLLNDHVLQYAVPGVITGKLSDIAWLIVAPVAVAAVLAWLGVMDRTARGAGIAVVGAAYTTLQLWPPLGETWVAWTGGAHVADAEDLLVLPALFLVPICWRRAHAGRFALPLATIACLATSEVYCAPSRSPLDGVVDWDPNAPLGIGFGTGGYTPHDTAGVLTAVTLVDDTGIAVQFVATTVGSTVWLCPIGGLQPDMDYTWTIDEMTSESANHLPTDSAPVGRSQFRTAVRPTVTLSPAFDEPGCRDLVLRLQFSTVCDDSGFVRDDTGGDTAVDTDVGDTDTDPGDTDTGLADTDTDPGDTDTGLADTDTDPADTDPADTGP